MRISFALASVLIPMLLSACNVGKPASTKPEVDTATISPQFPTYVPDGGYIATQEMALQICEIVLDSIYTKEKVDAEKPLQVILQGDMWIVGGTLPPGYKGGTVICRISKQTGQLLQIIHEK